MVDRDLRFTLREWRREILAPRVAVPVAVAGIVLGISGPFETYAEMPAAPRVLYWLVVACATFALGALNLRLVVEQTPARRLGRFPAHAVAGLVGGAPILALVWVVNRLATVEWPENWTGAGAALAYCTAINFCVCMARAWIRARGDAAAPDPARPVPPDLLKRLPVQVRGRLSHLSMQDHYVEVVTEKGSELVLMRLPDAISETRPVAGVRIHRSHWVAVDAVVRAWQEGGRHFVQTRGGAVLPVSRSRLPEAREAGLFAR